MRRFTGGKLVIATHNAGKLREFQALLAPYVKEIVSAAQLGLPEPEETGATFAENALLKAQAAAKASGHVALADDGGLCVTALGGKPGLHSARWAGLEKDFEKAMQQIQDELGASTDRSAYFMCALVLAWPDGHAETIEGRCDGTMVWPPRGDKGLGYDPVFIPEGYDCTFAEMGAEAKHKLSHRGKASRTLIEKCFAT